MKVKGLLMSPPMATKSHNGEKTNTRREIFPQPIIDHNSGFVFDGNHKTSYKNDMHHPDWRIKFIEDHCPYGQPGDVLWVREEHYAFGVWKKIAFIKKDKRRTGFKFEEVTSDISVPGYPRYYYVNNLPENSFPQKGKSRNLGWHKRPSLFMPKKACRTFLEITDIKIERLYDISQDDIIKEGIIDNGKTNPKMGIRHENMQRMAFEELWCKINGVSSWNANPWVWVIEFKKTAKPEIF